MKKELKKKIEEKKERYESIKPLIDNPSVHDDIIRLQAEIETLQTVLDKLYGNRLPFNLL